jgi:hypothetical protein
MTSRRFLLSLFCSVFGALASDAVAADRAETLRAINWVENPTNHHRRGSKGELGPYQFRPQTWRLHTKRSFALAVEREHADEIAIKHYDFIQRGLIQSGIDPTPFNIALAWNSGLGAVQRGRVPVVSYNYAERVANLVDAQLAQQSAAGPAKAAAPRAVAAAPAAVPAASDGRIQFNLAPAPASRFSLEAMPLVITEPVVATRSPVAFEEPVLKTDQPVFTLGRVAAPRIALIP